MAFFFFTKFSHANDSLFVTLRFLQNIYDTHTHTRVHTQLSNVKKT